MKRNSGFLIIEVLLAIVILSMVFLSIFSTLSFLANKTEKSKFDTQAASLMQEGMEQTRSSILANWKSFSPGEYYPVFNNATKTWTITEGNEGVLEGRFTRVISLEKVCRNKSDEGTQSNCSIGVEDLQSKIIKVKISWKEGNTDKNAEASLLVFKPK